MPDTSLFTTKTNIPYWEEQGYSESWQVNATKTTRTLRCLWEDRNDFLYEMLGAAQVSSGTLERDIPEEHPQYKKFWALGANLVTGVGVLDNDEATGLLRFRRRVPGAPSDEEGEDGYARYQVEYGPVPWRVISDDDLPNNGFEELNRYVIRDGQPGAEELPIKGRQLVYKDTNLPVGVEQVYISPRVNLVYTWKEVPSLPDNIFSMVGKINSVEFDGVAAGGRPYPPKTLFCHVPTWQRVLTAYGRFAYDINFNLEFKPNGHHKTLRGLDFVEVVREGTSNCAYEKDDFLKLFRYTDA